ncbi:hypothetical protein [Streptomyces sp. NPDC007984]|uniref:hypothetical protein n=1 Tax=Streptomyces sp. NPDC007984 TaxID=3364801 RepID=UPI0036E88666
MRGASGVDDVAVVPWPCRGGTNRQWQVRPVPVSGRTRPSTRSPPAPARAWPPAEARGREPSPTRSPSTDPAPGRPATTATTTSPPRPGFAGQVTLRKSRTVRGAAR